MKTAEQKYQNWFVGIMEYVNKYVVTKPLRWRGTLVSLIFSLFRQNFTAAFWFVLALSFVLVMVTIPLTIRHFSDFTAASVAQNVSVLLLLCVGGKCDCIKCHTVWPYSICSLSSDSAMHSTV